MNFAIADLKPAQDIIDPSNTFMLIQEEFLNLFWKEVSRLFYLSEFKALCLDTKPLSFDEIFMKHFKKRDQASNKKSSPEKPHWSSQNTRFKIESKESELLSGLKDLMIHHNKERKMQSPTT